MKERGIPHPRVFFWGVFRAAASTGPKLGLTWENAGTAEQYRSQYHPPEGPDRYWGSTRQYQRQYHPET
ncbi:hypothetical protein GCM10009678_04800 [Actinomadura kijaniata]